MFPYFSAGLGSGQYGGKKSNVMFLGICNVDALWKAPLSSTIILYSVGFVSENRLRKSWNIAELQYGSSNWNWTPVTGENAPKK